MGEGRKTDELLKLWKALAQFQVLLMKKSAPCRVWASPRWPPCALPSVCPFLPPSASSSSCLVIAFRIVMSASFNKTSQRISLSKALYNDNIYRRFNKICIEIDSEYVVCSRPFELRACWVCLFVKLDSQDCFNFFAVSQIIHLKGKMT